MMTNSVDLHSCAATMYHCYDIVDLCLYGGEGWHRMGQGP